jgi:dCMP deaminase
MHVGMDKPHDSLYPYGKKQSSFDRRYLEMAMIWAKNSYCKRRQVGALIVKDKMIISDGYNGTPSGFENVCEDDHFKTKPYVLHAEANAITKVAKSNNSSENATLYVTTSPCMECAKLIIQSGIRRVVYSDRYSRTEGLDLLKRAGIEIVFMELDSANLKMTEEEKDLWTRKTTG